MNYKTSLVHPSTAAEIPPLSFGATPAALFSDHFLLIDAKLSRTVIRARPTILVYSALAFFLCFSVGCAAVYYSGEVEEDAQRHAVYVGPSADLENSIRAEFDSLSSGTRQLASYVKFNPNCSTLDAQAEDYMREIMHWDDRISNLAILPSLVYMYRYPEKASLIGTDSLWNDNAASKEEIRREELWFSTPDGGVDGSFATYSIWLPASSYDVDLGCGLQPTNCADVCYNEKTGMKYYGSVRAQVDMSSWFSGSHVVLQNIRNQNIRARITVSESDSHEPETIVYETRQLEHPVSRTFQLTNLVWRIEIEPAAGWEPKWIDCMYFVVFAVSVCVLLSTTWVLIAKYRHEQLLASMLPASVIRHLVTNNEPFAEHFEDVTIFFSDIVDFTKIAAELEPIKVVELLDGMYSIFDRLAQKHGIYKVETIGDAYMAVAGCQTVESDPSKAALTMARFASDIVAAISVYRPVCLGEKRLQIRVGLHSGPVVAGVVGSKMPRYCLFGDTVNTAARMESTSEAMRIHLSRATAQLLSPASIAIDATSLDGIGDFTIIDDENNRNSGMFLENRGGVTIKGKGVMHTYWLQDTCAEEKSFLRFNTLSNSASSSFEGDHSTPPTADVSPYDSLDNSTRGEVVEGRTESQLNQPGDMV